MRMLANTLMIFMVVQNNSIRVEDRMRLPAVAVASETKERNSINF